MEFLSDKIHGYWKDGFINYVEKDYIKDNLNPNFSIRQYQQEAIAKFDFYLNKFPARPKNKPVHLLLNMATGSGKTVLMAANMLELYTKGYRNFVFIVNSNNIIKKTIANFTEKNNSKYLFADKIIIDFREVQINQVSNFEAVPAGDINILFSTIQGLHIQLKEPREGGLTFESLQQTKLVILSDEAHHLNTLTKKKRSKTEEDEETSWEWTIKTVIENHPENILLEYTATVDLGHAAIATKYADKILMRYSLREFHNDGYSKEIKLIKSGINTEERILQALVLNQYRLKVANEAPQLNSIYLPFKPVILFKSASIQESEKSFEEFKLMLKNLKSKQIEALKAAGGITLNKAFDFFKQNGITIEQITEEIKNAFRDERCIIVNNENDSDEKQIELNNLERNEYRAVFTVKMLTEGWDVLNLYDIVRLDESNGVNSNGKVAASTISEAQLIGRGARYFPFQLKSADEMFKRKFDKDLRSNMRSLEELYYHSTNDNKYIEVITKELVEQGVYDPEQDNEPVSLKVKPSFKQTSLWNDGFIFTNERILKSNKHVSSLKQIHETAFQYKQYVGTGATDEVIVFSEDAVQEDVALKKNFADAINKEIKLTTFFGLNICLKALENIPFYNFDNLKRILPQLTSTREFLNDKKWIAETPVTLVGTKEKLENLKPAEKIRIAENILRSIKNDLSVKIHRYEGSVEFEGRAVKSYLTEKNGSDKEILMMVNDVEAEYRKPMSGNPKIDYRLNIENAEWFVFDEAYGTGEEKLLVKYVADSMDILKEKYTDIYLLRNEKLFQIYDFKDGKAFEPDFVLFMKEKASNKKLSYQLFIEPKSPLLSGSDQEKWKEEFLEQIHIRAKIKKIEMLYEDDNYKIFGLPFYNYQTRNKFEAKFKDVVKV